MEIERKKCKKIGMERKRERERERERDRARKGQTDRAMQHKMDGETQREM